MSTRPTRRVLRHPATRKPLQLGRVGLLVLDVDGVLTDGRLYFGARGEALKVFHVRDGHGIKLLKASGVEVAAISGRRSAAVTARMRELNVRHVVQGCSDKVAALLNLTERLHIEPLACACLVDDTSDLPLMSAVGFAAAVADAHPLVRSAAHWVGSIPGGRGAVRELCDALLRARAARALADAHGNVRRSHGLPRALADAAGNVRESRTAARPRRRANPA